MMKHKRSGVHKRLAASLALALSLFTLGGLLSTAALAAEGTVPEESVIFMDDLPPDAPPPEEGAAQGEGAEPEETSEEENEEGEQQDPPETEEPLQEDPTEEPEEPSEEDEDGKELPSKEQAARILTAAPQSSESLAALTAGYPYGGTEDEQQAYLQTLPAWEEAVEETLIPKGWLQAETTAYNGESYWTLTPDLLNFVHIFDQNSLQSFLLTPPSGITGLLVDDIYMESTIAQTVRIIYNDHELDGDGHTIYAPPSGRHLSIVIASGSLTFTDVTFDGQGNAGGLEIKGYSNNVSASLTMNEVTVQNNVVEGNSAVYLANLTVRANDSDFLNNTTTGTYGGGLMLELYINANFDNCRFEGNQAPRGAGVYVKSSSTTLKPPQTIIFTNCSIDGNTSPSNAHSYGIGMSIDSPNAVTTLQNTTLNGNYAAGSSGRGVGLYVENGKTTTLNQVEFVGNYAENDVYGGAFYIANGTFNMDGCLVKDNQSRYFFGGGILYSQYATLTAKITNTVFTGNFTREGQDNPSTVNGGGALGVISLSYGSNIGKTSVTIEDCEFIANRAAPGSESSHGGAMSAWLHSSYDSVVIRRTNFEQNTAAHGGALYLMALDVINYTSSQTGYYRSNAIRLEDCQFRYNVATIAGGAIGTQVPDGTASGTNINKLMAFYKMFKGTNLVFEDNLAATGHSLPSSASSFNNSMRDQFGATGGTNVDPSILPLSAPFALNHATASYRTVYNNYDVAQNFPNTQVTSGTVDLVYHANGGTGLNGNTFTFTTFPNRKLPLLQPDDGSMGFTMENYRFVEWNTAYDGIGESYQPGELLTLTADMLTNGQFTLYAIWEYAPGSFTVTYRNEMGAETHSEPVLNLVDEMTVLSPEAAGFTTPDDHMFTHWLGSDGSTRMPGSKFVYDQTTMGTNLTLTAQWEEKPSLSVNLLYVDSEGQPLAGTALAENPQEVFANENEQLTISDLLATLDGYKALYYTLDGESTKRSLKDDPFTMTTVADGSTLLIHCASTLLDIVVPTSMEFFAMSSNGMEVLSPVYRFTNRSEMPAEVRFTQLHTTGTTPAGTALDTSGIHFVEEAASPYEMHLALHKDAAMANNAFETDFTGTNGKPGIQPDVTYSDVTLATLSGTAVQGTGQNTQAAFTIGGKYAGPYELATRTPTIAFEFHVSLLPNAEYDP